MKKTFKLLAMLFALAVLFAVFIACRGITDTENIIRITVGDNGAIQAVIKYGEPIDIAGEHQTIGQVLDALVAGNPDITFEYDGTADSDWGRFLRVLGDLRPVTANNEFIAVFLTYPAPSSHSTLPAIEVDSVTFYSANAGIDQLPVLNGITYLFAISTF